MEKPSMKCPRCGAELPEPAATGRPRVYCSPLCRRDAEYRLRRVQGHLARAERNLTSARLAQASASPYGYRDAGADAEEKVAFWTAEVAARSAELRTVLADLSRDGAEDAG